MSVTRGAGGFDEYEDLDVQLVSVGMEINSDLTSGSKGNQAQLHSIDPADGLQRGEVAELVAATHHFHASDESIAGNSDPGHVLGNWEVTTDPNPVLEGAFTETTDFDSITGLDVTVADLLDPGLIDSWRWSTNNAWSDDTNGHGGLGGNERIDMERDYRALFGSGPVYDRHDVIYWHSSVTQQGGTNTAATIQDAWVFYWNVFEE